MVWNANAGYTAGASAYCLALIITSSSLSPMNCWIFGVTTNESLPKMLFASASESLRMLLADPKYCGGRPVRRS